MNAQQIKDLATMVAAIIGCLIAIGGAYAALGLPQPVFHTKLTSAIAEVEKKYDTKVQELERHAQDTRGRVLELQLQSNRSDLNALRSEKLTRSLEAKKPDIDLGTKTLLEQRLNQIDERLEAVEEERKKLNEEKKKSP